MEDRFWETKSLDDMSREEWEAICDGCAKCCLHKFIDDDDAVEAAPTDYMEHHETIHYTNIACELLNTKTCSCTRYAERQELVPDCVKLTKDNLDKIDFMPPSCAYRLLHEGQDLPDWHPLVSGTPVSVVAAGMSVKGRVTPEIMFEGDAEDRVVDWPLDT